MKLLYGTGNPAKLAYMKRRLSALPIELLSLSDMLRRPLRKQEATRSKTRASRRLPTMRSIIFPFFRVTPDFILMKYRMHYSRAFMSAESVEKRSPMRK